LSDISSAPPKKKKMKTKAKKGDKGKGKAKARYSEDDSSEGEVEHSERGKKGKKVLVAREAKWKDIPNWKGRLDSPFLDLPAEVLDRVFAPATDLEVSLFAHRG
jgi:hypothetical protein